MDLFKNNHTDVSNQVSDIQQNIRWIKTVNEYLKNNTKFDIEITFFKGTELDSSSNFYSGRSLGFSTNTEKGKCTAVWPNG